MRLFTALLLAAAAPPGASAWSWPWSRHVSVHSSSVAPKTRMEDGSILMEWRSKPPPGSPSHHVSFPWLFARLASRLDRPAGGLLDGHRTK